MIATEKQTHKPPPQGGKHEEMIMKIVNTMTILALVLLGAMTPTLAEQNVALKDPFPIKIENWRGKPFYELLFMNRKDDGSGVGYYYNSLGKEFEATDEVMDARFRALNADTLKKEYGSDGILFNGPRRLVANGITGMAWDGGKERVIATIPFRVLGIFETPNLSKAVSEKMPAYEVLVSKRSNTFIFNAGETVCELITPEGAVYTLFSLSLKHDPKNTIENLPTLGKRLTLPKGWQYRSRKLDKDLMLTSTADSDPPNTIVLDELDGNYQFNDGASANAERKSTATGAFAPQTTPAEPKVLRDGDGAKSVRVDGLHKVRFAEIFLAGREAKTGKLVAACYNTSLLPDAVPASKDTAPQAWAEGLDFNKMKNEFGVLSASFNGPKIWMPDWIETLNGVVRDFNGRKVPWVGQLDMGDNTGGVTESTPYKPVTIARGDIGWYKGTTALLLDDAEGNTWIMKGFQVGLKPAYTFEQFVAAGQNQFKKLPPAWKFRVKVLDRDLTERPEGGVATIMVDEFFNVYDKTGPGMSDYKP